MKEMKAADIREELYQAIEKIGASQLSQVDYLYLVEGEVLEYDQVSGIYTFLYQGEEYNAVSLTGERYKQGEIVYILFSNVSDIKKIIITSIDRYSAFSGGLEEIEDGLLQIEAVGDDLETIKVTMDDWGVRIKKTEDRLSQEVYDRKEVTEKIQKDVDDTIKNVKDLEEDVTLLDTQYRDVSKTVEEHASKIDQTSKQIELEVQSRKESIEYLEKEIETIELTPGPKGEKGDPGRDGLPGKDGQPTYTWIKYADSPTSGMSDDPTGKAYIGFAYNKTTPKESDKYEDYKWQLVKGSDGIKGEPGKDGKVFYNWIAYADDENGKGISMLPKGKDYVGYAFNKESKNPSLDPKDYQWQKVKGDKGDPGKQGPQGIPGAPGKDGEPTYTWIMFADSPTSGISRDPKGKKYVGYAFNKKTPTPSTKYGDYVWQLTKGEDGKQGIPGEPGKDGKPNYTWVKYADDDKGKGMSNSPIDKKYIGLSFNNFSQQESNNPKDYQWSPLPQNFEVGGRNLVRESEWERGSTTISKYKTDIGYGHKIVSKPGVGWSRIYNYSPRRVKLKKGSYYTVSFYVEGEQEFDTYLQIADSNSVNRVARYDFSVTKNRTFHSYTYKHNGAESQNVSMQFFVESASPTKHDRTMYLEDVKWETGNIATDWTPAPEDIENQITEVNKKTVKNSAGIKNLDDQVNIHASKITTAEKGIKDLQGNYTQLDKTQKEQKSRLDVAYDRIESNVKEINSSKDRISKAESSIRQTAKDVTIQAERISNINTSENLALNGSEITKNNAYKTRSIVPSSYLVPGQQYTITLDITPADKVTSVAPYLSGGYSSQGAIKVTPKKRQTVSKTFKAKYHNERPPEEKKSYQHINIYRFPNNGTVTGETTIHRVKIEAGDRFTGWSDSPADNVLSFINVSPEKIKINSNKIQLEGYTTVNKNFWVDEKGNMGAAGGKIAGWTINNSAIYKNGKGMHSGSFANDPAFWVGDVYPWSDSKWQDKTHFYVNNKGEMHASKAFIKGNLTAGSVGGLKVGSSGIVFPNSKLRLNSKTNGLEFGSLRMKYYYEDGSQDAMSGTAYDAARFTSSYGSSHLTMAVANYGSALFTDYVFPSKKGALVLGGPNGTVWAGGQLNTGNVNASNLGGSSMSAFNKTNWNKMGLASITSRNNTMQLFISGKENERQGAIQVGHSQANYSQHLGTLHLNPLGGSVTINKKNVSDFVVSKGSNWRKWNSGVYERWGRVRLSNTTTNKKMGSGYWTGLRSLKFADSFYDDNVRVMFVTGNAAAGGTQIANRSGVNWWAISLDSPNRGVTHYTYYAIGRWK